MASVGVLSPDLLHKIGDYLDEQEHYWWQWVILKHTGSRLPPKSETSETSGSTPSTSRPTKAELSDKYLEYLKEEMEAKRVWRRLIRGLCVKLPTEMRLLVIKKDLESLFPRAVYHDHIRFQHYAKSFRSAVLVKDEFDLASTEIATEIFSKVNSQISDIQAKHTLPFNAQKTVDEIIEEAVKLIPKLCTYFLHANFPSKNSLTDEVVPTPWKPHVHEIKHLELTTRLMDFSSTRYYPVELFKAQDQIANLKRWFPGLQSVSFTIIEGTEKQRDYLERGTSQQTTSLAVEIEKIVEQMQKLDVSEKGIRLCVRNGLHRANRNFDYYDVETRSAWDNVSETDTKGMSCQEITMVAISQRLKLVRILDQKQEAGDEESTGETHS